MRCVECNYRITRGVFSFSLENYGVPLCREHQDWVENMYKESTPEAIKLYLALKERGVPAELEKFDGYKHIDIAVTEAKVNIEVDGGHHNFSKRQAFSDLKRTYYSFKKGYFTLRIPNALLTDDIEDAVDFIVDLLKEGRDRSRW